MNISAKTQNYVWSFIFKNFTKPHQEIWLELNGHKVYEVVPEDKSSYYSISKTKTFTPASNDKAYVFARLVKNIENACIKARRYQLAATKISILLRSQDFRHSAIEAKLDRATNFPGEIVGASDRLFEAIFKPEIKYRLTGVVLSGLVPASPYQVNLFDQPLRLEKIRSIYEAVDNLAAKYGKHTVRLAIGNKAHLTDPYYNRVKNFKARAVIRGENKRQHLGIPLLV